jgi:RHS repeat-associated protein
MHSKVVVRIALSCLFTLGVAFGQQPLNPADGSFTQDFGVDSINLQSLAITVKAPVLGKPGAIPFGYAFVGSNSCQGATLNGTATVVCGYLNQYNASLQCENSYCLSLWPVTTAGFWSLQVGTTLLNQVCGDGGVYTKYTNFTLVSPDGSTYSLPTTAYAEFEAPGHGTGACDRTFTALTTNGGIRVTSDDRGHLSSLTLPDGKVYDGALTDTFGNSIAPVTGGYSDTLAVNPALSITAQSGGTGEIDSYKDTGGTSHQVKQVLTPETVKTTFGCVGWPDQTLTGKYAVTEVDYPDGNNLYLSYETVTGGITGRIHQLTLRTGGTVTYGYGMVYCNAGTLIPQSLTRTDANGTTTYSVTIQTNGTTTTVLDPGKNKTVYTFQGANIGSPIYNVPLTLTQVQKWTNQGTVASPSYAANESRTTLYCYNNNTTNCATTQSSYPITAKDVYVTLDGKATSSRTKYTYDTYGNVTEIDRYPFTTVGTGTIDNKTVITYGSWNGSACVAVGSNILNLPCRITTTNGAGTNTLADQVNTYSSKGFMTATSKWKTGTTWIVTGQATPNPNGTAATTTNATGAVTTYSYAATGSGGCNAILPTGTSVTVNSVTMTTGTTWDCNMGKMLSFYDANGSSTSKYQYTYDLLGRPFSQADPLSYTLSERYPSATTSTVSDTTYFTTTTTVDGLGRPIRSQKTDGTSYDTVSTSYGFTANSNTQFEIQSSQPCIVTTLGSDCTKNHFQDIDPMGRTYITKTTSNETVIHNFTQNDVSEQLSPPPSGENNKAAQIEYDGLGRISSVCALQAAGGTSCGQFDGNSGILNSFTYTYRSGTIQVDNVRGSQTHTTIMDTLGRVTSVKLPETGTNPTLYVYDSDSSSSAVCANRTSPGALLRKTYPDGSYACYVVDSLGRTTDIGVANSSGINAGRCKRFRFDSTSSSYTGYTAPTGYTGANTEGRLMEAATDDCTFPLSQAHMITDEWFAYDDDGRVTDVWETTLNSGGWYHTQQSYYPNGQLNALSGVPGKSTYTITLDSNGRPDASTYGTTTVGRNVTYNAAGQPKEIDTNSASDNDQYTYDDNTGLMKTWSFTIGALNESATLTWNPNRTLKTLAITDGFNASGTQTCHYNPTDSTGTGYDDVGRLVGVNCGTPWSQTYTYDQYDNFSKSGTTNWNPGYSISPSNNHMLNGATYDGNGRVTYDTNNSYAWDVYGKMITANSGSSLGSCGAAGVTCVTYDAFGRPAQKNVAATITEFLYSPIGLTAIMSGTTTNNMRVPVPGGAIFNSSSTGLGNTVLHMDWLGTARVGYALGGTKVLETSISPYGEKYATSTGTGLLNFTGDFQDLYSGLYDTPNREFDVTSGSRWLSPDPARMSWNGYAYPTNPNSSTDPSGLDGCPATSKTCKPRPLTGSGDTDSDDAFSFGGVMVTSPDGAFGLLYPSYFGSTTTNSNPSVVRMGQQLYQLVPYKNMDDCIECKGTWVPIGNDLGLAVFRSPRSIYEANAAKNFMKPPPTETQPTGPIFSDNTPLDWEEDFMSEQTKIFKNALDAATDFLDGAMDTMENIRPIVTISSCLMSARGCEPPPQI